MKHIGASSRTDSIRRPGGGRLAGLCLMMALSLTVSSAIIVTCVANASWVDTYCQKHPSARICEATPDPTPSPTNIKLTEVQAVPNLTDETATYVFNSTAAGVIVYGGAAGEANKKQAVAGNNTVSWTLTEGTYGNCTIKVGNSNTLVVPAFKVTKRYPVVFVHGRDGSGSGWNTAKAYLKSQGWDASLLIAKSITESNSSLCDSASPNQAAEVAEWVDDVLDQFPGFDKVDLVGHSRGGSNIMRALWHGYIDTDKVRYVVTLAGMNRNCAPYYPPIPRDETPGSIKYSVYYSDGTPDNDSAVNYSNTYVKGAYMQNIWPLSHSEMKSDTAALQVLKTALLGTVGSN